MTRHCNVVNLQVMKRGKNKKKRVLPIVLLSVLFIAAAVSATCFFVLPTFTVVSDSAYSQVLYRPWFSRIRLSALLNGSRLRVVTLEDSAFDDGISFSAALERVSGGGKGYVFLSPAVSYFAVRNSIDVSAVFDSAIVSGFAVSGGNDVSSFDCVFVSDEKSGWLDASRKLAAEPSVMNEKLALIFSRDRISYSDDIASAFPSDTLSVFKEEGGNRLFASLTMDEMKKNGIVLALCPYVENLSSFFSSGSSVYWIVDYRFAPAVPKGRLFGVVAPDFIGALKVAKGAEKRAGKTYEMGYVYEAR